MTTPTPWPMLWPSPWPTPWGGSWPTHILSNFVLTRRRKVAEQREPRNLVVLRLHADMKAWLQNKVFFFAEQAFALLPCLGVELKGILIR